MRSETWERLLETLCDTVLDRVLPLAQSPNKKNSSLKDLAWLLLLGFQGCILSQLQEIQ